jgi:hypothetical protein
MPPYNTVVKRVDELGLQGRVGAHPDLAVHFDQPLAEFEPLII